MASLIDIRRRIRAVKSIQQITQGDEDGRRVEAAARAGARDRRPALRRVAPRRARERRGARREARHPLLARQRGFETETSCSSSSRRDKGLAGAFNTNVNRAVGALLREKSREEVRLLPVGKKAVRLLEAAVDPDRRVVSGHLLPARVRAREGDRRDPLGEVRLRGDRLGVRRLQRVQVDHGAGRARRPAPSDRADGDEYRGAGDRLSLRAGPRRDPRASPSAVSSSSRSSRCSSSPTRPKIARADDRDGLVDEERRRHDRFADADYNARDRRGSRRN